MGKEEFDKGMLAYQKEQFKDGFYFLEKSALIGNVEGQFVVGGSYYYGDGVEQNYVKAMEWFLKAAKQNHGRAIFYIGTLYRDGKGVEVNPKEAEKWFHQAANLEVFDEKDPGTR